MDEEEQRLAFGSMTRDKADYQTKAKKGLKSKKRVKTARPMKAKDGKIVKRSKRGKSTDSSAGESELTDLEE